MDRRSSHEYATSIQVIADWDDLTDEQARQLKAIFDGLTVTGTASPGDRGPDVRPVRNIEHMLEEIKNRS